MTLRTGRRRLPEGHEQAVSPITSLNGPTQVRALRAGAKTFGAALGRPFTRRPRADGLGPITGGPAARKDATLLLLRGRVVKADRLRASSAASSRQAAEERTAWRPRSPDRRRPSATRSLRQVTECFGCLLHPWSRYSWRPAGRGRCQTRILRDAPVVEVQEPTQALTACDRQVLVGSRLGRWGRRDQLVPEALMIAFEMIVLDELGHGRAKDAARRAR
jgi:hypothetical protein